MPNKKDNLGKKIDKLIVGAVIGGAIGSVLGLAVAPQEGKKTREAISEKTKTFMSKHEKELSTAKQLTRETVSGLYNLVKNRIKKKK
ncbi:MAG: YtxH domain-containing protein [Patescibacteria group bacterium]|nr:YtxH domain-containing protein [Patescibacteria group bacterium]